MTKTIVQRLRETETWGRMINGTGLDLMLQEAADEIERLMRVNSEQHKKVMELHERVQELESRLGTDVERQGREYVYAPDPQDIDSWYCESCQELHHAGQTCARASDSQGR